MGDLVDGDNTVAILVGTTPPSQHRASTDETRHQHSLMEHLGHSLIVVRNAMKLRQLPQGKASGAISIGPLEDVGGLHHGGVASPNVSVLAAACGDKMVSIESCLNDTENRTAIAVAAEDVAAASATARVGVGAVPARVEVVAVAAVGLGEGSHGGDEGEDGGETHGGGG